MAEKIKIFALGGLDEAGKNMTVVEIDRDIFIIDCGYKFPNKLTPGIDFIIPNPSYIIKNKDRVKAYFITQHHDEHLGALPFFYSNAPAPIFTTRFTASVIQTGNLFNDYDVKFNVIVKPATCEFTIAGHRINFFQTCHNSVESFGLSIHTSLGNIIYSGEYIVDFDTKYPAFTFDIHALNLLSQEKTLLLMAQSKGSMKAGYCSPNHKITPLIQKYFVNSTGRIFVGAFWQNAYTLLEIVNLCVRFKKKIIFYDMLTKKIVMDMLDNRVIKIPRDLFINYDDVLRYPESDEVFLILDNSDFIFYKIKDLCHGRNEDKRIKLKLSDTFLLCTPPSDNLEDLFGETVNDLVQTGVDVHYLKRKDLASMHARRDDLRLMLSLFKPQYYLPIQGSYSEMLENAKLALSMGIGLNHMNVFIMENGTVISFDERGKARLIEDPNIEASDIIVDGLGVSDIHNEILTERNQIGASGVVIIACSISLSKRKIVTKPDCQMRGFVFVKESEPILRQVTNIFVDCITQELERTRDGFDNQGVCQTIKETLRKTLRYHTRRDPLVCPIIIEEA